MFTNFFCSRTVNRRLLGTSNASPCGLVSQVAPSSGGRKADDPRTVDALRPPSHLPILGRQDPAVGMAVGDQPPRELGIQVTLELHGLGGGRTPARRFDAVPDREPVRGQVEGPIIKFPDKVKALPRGPGASSGFEKTVATRYLGCIISYEFEWRGGS